MTTGAYICSEGIRNKRSVIWIRVRDNQLPPSAVRLKFPMARWSNSQRCWYIPDSATTRKLLGMPPKMPFAWDSQRVTAVNKSVLRQTYEQLMLKGYSPNTISVYLQELTQLLVILKDFPAESLSPERLKSYFLYCVDKLQLSENHLNSRINAIKFYYEQVLHRQKMFFDIPRPKKPRLLPHVLDKAEIARILEKTDNPKHQLMLKLCYGMGLRVSEIVGLKPEHIDSKRMQVLISAAKGKKDRYVNLPESVLHELRTYYKNYRPGDYLFEGQHGGQYAIRSVQAVFKEAMKKARIRKKVGIHGLRHSYATHLLEAGTDITFIQKLLGHNNIKTTQIYTHVGKTQIAKVKSPLDTL